MIYFLTFWLMEIVFHESDDVKKKGERASEILDIYGPKLNSADKLHFLLFKQRAEVLKKIEKATGLEFRVFDQKATAVKSNVAAMADIDARKAYIGEHMLNENNADFAVYAAQHEAKHLKSSIKSLDLDKLCNERQKGVLRKLTGVSDLTSIDFMEGFNDLATIREHGKNDKSGYLEKEVPAAMKLEEKANKHLNLSLVELFDAGRKEHLVDKIRLLCELILLKKDL